uniref:Transmembrane protein n=1 Tax=Gongylonema pulchrum TaxID=637853 RepID=A0A183CZJ0_9BILA
LQAIGFSFCQKSRLFGLLNEIFRRFHLPAFDYSGAFFPVPERSGQNLLGPMVTCNCGHLASCRRATPLLCSRGERTATTTQALKHRFTLVKWCCFAFLLLIFALIVFSGLLTSASSELSLDSSFLFLAIISMILVLFAGLCCLRARAICRNRAARHGSAYCRRVHSNHPRSFRIPASFFAHTVHTRPHIHPSPSSFRFSESSL